MSTVLEPSPHHGHRDGCVENEVLTDAVADSVCAFLGHPRHCPHGQPIPPGTCCSGGSRRVEPLVQPLGQLKPGDEARIVHLASRHPDQLTRLSNLGVVPGAVIRLRQRRPAAVIAIGETQLAIDPEITELIYVRRLR